ncbi:NAD(P)H-dependent oxidoreductase [Parvularcula sp. ZS-1/3]|uniref:NAD(P)H-dependent oxidoreductase n=1 Tax=Parvularcula mediterranea TaxID=2732508 RepID=A0A7Y3RNW5_9PROT|nr:NAD(P)H-dependent oxidoreductase [Parvularcula mediterranea]NNU17552.1 NAD(P)H-dependent oxidoreductase [Parvularcula mediterranea]
MTDTKTVTLFLGHPDPGPSYCRALAERYKEHAEGAGHRIIFFDAAAEEVPFLRSQREFEEGEVPEPALRLQKAIKASNHLVLIFPMWMGTLPALTKGVIEQTFREGFALDTTDPKTLPKQLLRGKSARIIMTMGMPAFLYRHYFRAHGLKNLERNLLKFAGFGPVRTSLIGGVQGGSDSYREKWLERAGRLGAMAI